MSGHVKGKLFVDYVRTIRAYKDVRWLEHFRLEDLSYLSEHIEPDAWYPMDTFERMGLAILKLVANNEMDTVKAFGSASADWLLVAEPQLLVLGDPAASIANFHAQRQHFFDFPAIEVMELGPKQAMLSIRYGMGPIAEQAASMQVMGFFLRLIERAGGVGADGRFSARAWEGAERTLLVLSWA